MKIRTFKLRDGLTLEIDDGGSVVCRSPDGGSIWYEDPRVAARDLRLDEDALVARVNDVIAEWRRAKLGGGQ